MGSITTIVPGASASQCSSVCGADEEGLAPQTRMQEASAADRGSNPISDEP